MLRIVPTGTINGVNLSFTLPQISVSGAPTFVILNGQKLGQVLTAPTASQCILSESALTMGVAPVPADDFFVLIQTSLAKGLVEVPLEGIRNGGNLIFTLTTTPPVGSSLMVYLNGLLLNEVGAAPTVQQYVLSGFNVILGVAPTVTDFLTAHIEEPNSLAFVHLLDMQGAGTQWATALSTPASYDPLLAVFLNGQLQQEVLTAPLATQYYRQTSLHGILIVTLGISLIPADDLLVYVIGLRLSLTLAPSLPLYLNVQNELLVLMNEQIGLEEAKMCLNRRWQKILNTWTWSFVKADGVLTTKAPKSTGSLSVTQDGVLVVGNGTTFAVTDIGAYLRLGSQLYLVVDVQVLSATQQILLIVSPYPGTTNTALSYQLFYKDYALAPDVVDILSMRGSTWQMDELTQVSLDSVDMNSACVGQPLSFIRRGMSADGIYQVELWPVPDARYTIQYTAVMRSVLTQKGQIIPDIAEMLLMTAEEMACGIVSSKRAAEKDYEGAAFWASKGAARIAHYQESLAELKAKDRRRFGQNTNSQVSTYSNALGYGWGGRESY